MADFDGAIPHRGRALTTRECARRHAKERAFIERELAEARKSRTTAVVITHHAPSGRFIGEGYEGDPCNPASASDLERLIGEFQSALWNHGHMHHKLDYTLAEIRVLCNPAGYDADTNERRGYNPQLCVEIAGTDRTSSPRSCSRRTRSCSATPRRGATSRRWSLRGDGM